LENAFSVKKVFDFIVKVDDKALFEQMACVILFKVP